MSLSGHSYGGAVITPGGSLLSNVLALVYVAAFTLEAGESVLDVSPPSFRTSESI
jgi:hypothetical protein